MKLAFDLNLTTFLRKGQTHKHSSIHRSSVHMHSGIRHSCPALCVHAQQYDQRGNSCPLFTHGRPITAVCVHKGQDDPRAFYILFSLSYFFTCATTTAKQKLESICVFFAHFIYISVGLYYS